MQVRYKQAWDLYLQANMEAMSRRPEPPPPDEVAKRMRMAQAASYLAEHLHEAPVLLFVCLLRRDDLPLTDDEGPAAHLQVAAHDDYLLGWAKDRPRTPH